MSKSRHSVNAWLKNLDAKFNLDDSGRCFLQRDNQTGVVVYAPEEGDEVFLYGDLMRVPDNMPPTFYEKILTLNSQTSRTNGAFITFEASSNQLLRCSHSPYKRWMGRYFRISYKICHEQ